MGSPVVRWQMVSPQPAETASFYRQVFGWTISQDNALGYREVSTAAAPARGIDGGIWPGPPGEKGFVQLFVEVPDIDACVAKAVALGARVIVPKAVLPDGDTMAILLDPGGVSVGICTLRVQPPRAP